MPSHFGFYLYLLDRVSLLILFFWQQFQELQLIWQQLLDLLPSLLPITQQEWLNEQ